MDADIKTAFDQMDMVCEFFALPIGLKEVIKLDGKVSLYSSPSLIQKYNNALSNQKQFRGAEKLIQKLIAKHRILPVFLNKGFFSLTIFKLFADTDSKSTCGFYSPSNNLIVILIDNNMTLGWVSNKIIGKLTSHELCHMASNHMKLNFFKLFRDDLILYYSQFFYFMTKCRELLDGKGNQIIEDYILNLFKNIEMKMSSASSLNLDVASNNFEKTMADIHINFKSTDNVVRAYSDQIINLHNIILESYDKNGLNGVIGVFKKFPDVTRYFLSALLHSYSVFNKREKPTIFPIQELFFPSEVICVKSEVQPDTKYIQAWSNIK